MSVKAILSARVSVSYYGVIIHNNLYDIKKLKGSIYYCNAFVEPYQHNILVQFGPFKFSLVHFFVYYYYYYFFTYLLVESYL